MMNPNDAEPEAEPFSDLLAAYDNDLAAGRNPASPSSVPPELAERLARAQARCCAASIKSGSGRRVFQGWRQKRCQDPFWPHKIVIQNRER